MAGNHPRAEAATGGLAVHSPAAAPKQSRSPLLPGYHAVSVIEPPPIASSLAPQPPPNALPAADLDGCTALHAHTVLGWR
uniref:Uncharacterized protein n=1 Tax=Leersia perrieri TaxID=77586 RepID=A0A0D9W3H1_9ORYZ